MEETTDKDIEQKKIDWIQKYYEIQVRCIEANLNVTDSYARLYKSQRNYLEWSPKFARTSQKIAVVVAICVSVFFLVSATVTLIQGDLEKTSYFLNPWVWFTVGYIGAFLLFFHRADPLAEKMAKEIGEKGLNLTINGTYKVTTYCSVKGEK